MIYVTWKGMLPQLSQVTGVYQQSRLIAFNSRLVHFSVPFEEMFGDETNRASEFYVYYYGVDVARLFIGSNVGGKYWSRRRPAVSVGLQPIRRLQRFWRAVMWRRRALAFMMSGHVRLGRDSLGHGLNEDMLRLCCLLQI